MSKLNNIREEGLVWGAGKKKPNEVNNGRCTIDGWKNPICHEMIKENRNKKEKERYRKRQLRGRYIQYPCMPLAYILETINAIIM